MSLIEELGVSLKDFVPGYSDHNMVHPQNDPPVVISKSLFERLKTYARENGLSISAALALAAVLGFQG